MNECKLKMLVSALREYSQDLIAYKLGCAFADACNDAAEAIEQLVRDNNVLTKERDAAYEALNRLKECSTCNHYHECGYDDIECVACENGSEYVFGGVKE